MKKINDKEIISELANNLYSCERLMCQTYINLSKQLPKSNKVVVKIKNMNKRLGKLRCEIDDEISEYMSSELVDEFYKKGWILYNNDSI